MSLVPREPQFESRPSESSTGVQGEVAADGSLSVLKVNPMVWRHALAAADGDARRIEIIDETNVTVHNRRVR
jgi:hypothetical protein